MANLPNKNCLCNYNARDYDPTTHTIPGAVGQNFNQDLVLNEPVTAYTTASITIDGQYMDYDFGSYENNLFNRTGQDTFTIVAKISKGLDDSGEHCIFSCRDDYNINYLLFNPANGADNNIVYLHNDNRFYTDCPYVELDAEPNIFAIRIDQGAGYGQSYTDGETFRSITNIYGGSASKIGFFDDSIFGEGFESWRGEFYWLYISNDALTDSEIAEVIAYNEASGNFDVDPTEISAESGASAYTISVSAETGVSWSASTNDSWISLAPTTGEGNGSITVSVAEAGYTARTGEITITSSEGDSISVSVSQPRKPLILTRKDMYRGGNVINKMMRNGEVIYQRIEGPTE